jgi:exosortase C (VPDSG-CTERM-specific)
MRSSSNGAAAREPTISVQTGNISRSSPLKHRQKSRFLGAACFAVVLAAVFGHSLLTLITYAASSQLHSYILLIPFVSAYLLYIRRDQLPKKYSVDLPLAIVSLAIGLGILIFTYWFDFAGRAPGINDRLTLLTISFLCCLAAGVFFFLGRTWMRAAAFPLAYLSFMIPMPDTMAEALEQASSAASAEMANLFFHLSGMPFLRAGQIFQLPNITLVVGQECSGIRSANLFLKTTWRRFVLVAIVIPLGILRNGFRIFVIGLLCVHVGPQMIHSLIHRRGGPLFFVISLVPLLLVLWLLRKGEEQTRFAE